MNMTFMPYGARWRRHRALFWEHFQRDPSRAYQPTQRAVAHVFLDKLLHSPERLREHIRLYAVSISAAALESNAHSH